MAQQNVGRLGVVLGLDTAEFVRGMQKASTTLADFVDKMKPAIATGVAAFTALTYKATQYADKMSDVAKANNVAISTVLEMGKALKYNGGETENVNKLYSTFSQRVDDAASGTKKIQDAFLSIGISLKDLGKLSQQELLEKTVRGLAAIEDPIRRNALGMQVFGKAMQGVDIQGFAASMDDLKGKFDDQAAGLEALADMMGKLEEIYYKVIGGFAKSVGTDLAATVDYFVKFADKLGFVGRAIEIIFETVAVLAANVAFVIERIFAGLNMIMDSQFILSSEYRKKALAQYNQDSAKLRSDLDEFEKRIMRNASAGETDPAKAPTLPTVTVTADREVVDAYAKQLEAMKKISEQFALQQQAKLEMLEAQGITIGMSEKERELYMQILAIEQERRKTVEDIDRQIAQERAGDNNSRIIEGLTQQKDAVNALAKSYMDLTRAAIEANEMRIRQQQILTNEERRALDSTVNNLAELGKHNKAAFKAWKAMAIAQAMIDTYTSAVASYKALAGIPIVGPALGFTAAAIAVAAGLARVAMIKNTQYQGREKGGVMSANQPYMVGERGPEMVIPNKSSMVVPNHSLSSVMGNGQQVVYNGPYIANMQAIDTQSATQFLARNKDAVYAANISASRSLPVSR